ncbi:regulatory protein GemA [Microvirga sp. 2MCAF35]|uniref:regulatory protein GemA n=1 Tax=Microvirga sp. 2MCAF35 TaxID=3232987 RepID=UPI003F9CC4B9
MPSLDQLEMIERGRQQLFKHPGEWRAVLLQFGGVERVEDLDARGAVRVLDRLFVSGFRDRRLPSVAPDYCNLLRRWQRAAGFSDAMLSSLVYAISRNNPEGLDGTRILEQVTVAEFGRILSFFETYGFDVGELPHRSVMTKKQVALLHVAKKELGFSDEAFMSALCCYGGGVVSSGNLDQRGFDRLLVYFEALGFVSNKRKPRPAQKSGFGHRKGMATPAQVELIQGLWRDWNGSDDAAALGRWLEKSYGVSALRFLKQNEAGKAITGLRAMVRRRKGAAA